MNGELKRTSKQVALSVFSVRIHAFVWREWKITKGINRNILFRFKTRNVGLRKTRQLPIARPQISNLCILFL